MTEKERKYSTSENGLRPLPGTLETRAFGWRYSRDGRRYSLSGWPVADLEADVNGRVHWRRIDPQVAVCRESLAEEIARGDESFARVIRRDLWLLAWHVRLALAELEDRDDDATAEPRVALLVEGIDVPTARRLGKAALRAGGRVHWKVVEE